MAWTVEERRAYHRAYARRWKLEHPKKHREKLQQQRERRLKWRQEHPEAARAADREAARKWRAKHPGYRQKYRRRASRSIDDPGLYAERLARAIEREEWRLQEWHRIDFWFRGMVDRWIFPVLADTRREVSCYGYGCRNEDHLVCTPKERPVT